MILFGALTVRECGSTNISETFKLEKLVRVQDAYLSITRRETLMLLLKVDKESESLKV